MTENLCPKCGAEGERVNDRAMYEYVPPTNARSFGDSIPIKCHTIDGPGCLRRQLEAARERIKELEMERNEYFRWMVLYEEQRNEGSK